MSLQVIFGHHVPEYLRTLPFETLEVSPASLTLTEWVRFFPFVFFLFLFGVLLPVTLFAAILKIKDPHKGLFQFSPSFSSFWPFLASTLPNTLALIAINQRGSLSWLVFFVGYVVVPILDLLVGENAYNSPIEEERLLKKSVYFRAVTWLNLPLQILVLTYGAFTVSTADLTTAEYWGLIVSVGTASGFGIGCVHELIHRPARFEFWMGVISCSLNFYPHFPVEHIQGHHKRVATDFDPATSRRGESVYAFFPRVLYGSLISALDIERRYQTRKGRSFFNIRNRILLPAALSAAVFISSFYVFGLRSAIFLVLSGLVSSLTLENVNFIEHWDLRRRPLVDDKGDLVYDKDGEQVFDRPGWFDAWNTGDRVTNAILFNIQRHPEHHTNAGRPYQILRTFKESPTLPTGYTGMVLLSWFPWLWDWVMGPLADKARQDRQEMERAGKNYFPSGANNISSSFHKVGEGFYQKGSSPYEDNDFYEDDHEKKSDTAWDEDYEKIASKFKVAATKNKVQ